MLKYTCDAHVSWFGNQLDLPEQLPMPVPVKNTINDKYRVYMNKSWIDKHIVLGKQIIDRELELGMQPIQQGFHQLFDDFDPNGARSQQENACWGYPLVAGNLHNFGGRINHYGAERHDHPA